jgi:hypothetical protein
MYAKMYQDNEIYHIYEAQGPRILQVGSTKKNLFVDLQ